MAKKSKGSLPKLTDRKKLPTLPKLNDQSKLSTLPKLTDQGTLPTLPQLKTSDKLGRPPLQEKYVPLLAVAEGWIVGYPDDTLSIIPPEWIASSGPERWHDGWVDPTMKAKHITEGFVFMEGDEEITLKERKVGNYLVWCGYGPRTRTWVTRGEPGRVGRESEVK